MFHDKSCLKIFLETRFLIELYVVVVRIYE